MGTRGFVPAVVIVISLLITGGCERADRDILTRAVEKKGFTIVIPAEGHLRASESSILSAPNVPFDMTIASLTREGEEVAAEDIVVRLDSHEARKAHEEAISDLAEIRAEIEKRESASRIHSEILDLERRTADFGYEIAETTLSSRDERISSRNDIVDAELERELAKIGLEKAEKSQNAKSDIVSSELEILKIREKKAEEKLKNAEEWLDSLKVRAPYEGMLTYYRRGWWEEGAYVGESKRSGASIVEVHDLSKMEAVVQVLDKDGGLLEEGQAANVMLDPFPEVKFPGTVKSVGKVAAQRGWRSPVKYFEVVISLDETDPDKMRSGMEVRAEIEVFSEEKALLVPRYALFREGEESFVYVENGGELERRPVETGTGSREEVMILSGLLEGDRIALLSPSVALQEEETGGGELPGE